MKRRLLSLTLILALLLCLCGCSETGNDSSFCIYFIDVGQGDAALIECDGDYMLIDGGDLSAEDTVYDAVTAVLGKNTELDILAISHLHSDHYRGLEKTLDALSSIDLVISNSNYNPNESFKKIEKKIITKAKKGEISVPPIDDKEGYELGSAKVKVIDNSAERNNDSLVLLIEYYNTRFLFTGDMEAEQEAKLCDRLEDKKMNVTLLKVAHHGSKTGTSERFLKMVTPQYAVISVGAKNKLGHPSNDTIVRLKKYVKKSIYMTKDSGHILVKSNGKNIKIKTFSSFDYVA